MQQSAVPIEILSESEMRIARSEGWEIDPDGYQINAVGSNRSDEDAWELVWERAVIEGSELHKKALRRIAHANPREIALIVQHCFTTD